LENTYFVDKNYFKRLWNAYLEYLYYLRLYEDWKISRNILSNYELKFKKLLEQTKKLLSSALKKQVLNVWYVQVENYVVNYENKKLELLVNQLDKLIVQKISWYPQEKIKQFWKFYNKFKLAVKYMKEKNHSEGLKIAKNYLQLMLKLLN
jgi:hypothetical protein